MRVWLGSLCAHQTILGTTSLTKYNEITELCGINIRMSHTYANWLMLQLRLLAAATTTTTYCVYKSITLGLSLTFVQNIATKFTTMK